MAPPRRLLAMFQVVTLGGLAIRRDGSPLDISRIRKPAALLAVVAASDGIGVSRDRLQALFWPESDTERARAGVKQAHYLVRQALGVDPFSAHGQNLGLEPSAIEADIVAFQKHVNAGRLTDAVALYGGPFLDGVYLKDVPEFERWVEHERARLSMLFANALERLASDAKQQGDAATATAWLRRRAELDPTDGRIARQYIEALIATGDRAAAIRHARVHTELLRSELDAEPDPELVALIERVRATPTPVSFPPEVSNREPATQAPGSTTLAVETLQRSSGTRFTRLLGYAGLSALIVAGVIAAIWWRATSFVKMQVGTTVAPVADTPAYETEPSISPDGKFVAYSGSTPQGMRIFIRQHDGDRSTPVSGDLREGNHVAPHWSPDGSRIVFASDRGVYVVAALGGSPKLLFPIATSAKCERKASAFCGVTLAWSPDGERVAHTVEEGIRVGRSDGSADRLLVGGRQLYFPAWSPDGNYVAFVQGARLTPHVIGSTSIWIVTADGRRRTRVSDSVFTNTSPVWAPDGKSILYISNRGGGFDVYQQALAFARPFGEPRRLTAGLGAATLSMSADGSRIAYDVVHSRNNIWSVNAAATGAVSVTTARPVTTENQRVEMVSLSHDGKSLAYSASHGGNAGIFKLRLDGGQPVRLTSDAENDFNPVWSPNDQEIGFYSSRSGSRRVFVMDADGHGQRQVSWGPDEDQRMTTWSPDGRQIVIASGRIAGPYQTYLITREAPDHWGPAFPFSLAPGKAVRWSRDGWLTTRDTMEIVAISPDRRVSRVIMTASQVRGPIRSHELGQDPSVVFALVGARAGGWAIWAASRSAAAPRMVVAGDSIHVLATPVFATDGRRFFFMLVEIESDVYVADLKR